MLCQQVVDHLLAAHPDRFAFIDYTPIRRVTVGANGARLAAPAGVVTASRVVLCTNGFADHVIENESGAAIPIKRQHRVRGTVGVMAGFFESEDCAPAAISYAMSPLIGPGQAYFYVTRRPFERNGRTGTLVCVDGPDERLDRLTDYQPTSAFPKRHREAINAFVRATVETERAEVAFDYAWHGVMAYSESKLRVIASEPRNPVLLHNLGCNGVGSLPSIYGGDRVTRFLRAKAVEPSVLEPS